MARERGLCTESGRLLQPINSCEVTTSHEEAVEPPASRFKETESSLSRFCNVGHTGSGSLRGWAQKISQREANAVCAATARL